MEHLPRKILDAPLNSAERLSKLPLGNNPEACVETVLLLDFFSG